LDSVQTFDLSRTYKDCSLLSFYDKIDLVPLRLDWMKMRSNRMSGGLFLNANLSL